MRLTNTSLGEIERRRRVISVTAGALGGGDDSLVGDDFAFRAVAGVAVADPGHENIGG